MLFFRFFFVLELFTSLVFESQQTTTRALGVRANAPIKRHDLKWLEMLASTTTIAPFVAISLSIGFKVTGQSAHNRKQMLVYGSYFGW
jgi:hypothetical protein